MFKRVLSELMRKIKSLLAIPIVVGSMTLMVPPSQSQAMSDVKLGVSGKTIKEIKKAAKKAKDELKIGGCAGTREGCDPEKKIKKLFNKKMKKCVKAPCPAW